MALNPLTFRPAKEAGFSLIGILTASVILAIISSAISALIVGMNKDMVKIIDKSDYFDLFQEVKSDFNRKNLCETFYKGKTLRTSPPYIGTSALNQAIKINATDIGKELPYLTNPSSSLTFDDFYLKLVEKISPNIFKAKLFLSVRKHKKMMPHIRPKAISLNITTTGSNTVDKCGDSDSDSSVIEAKSEVWKDGGTAIHLPALDGAQERTKKIKFKIETKALLQSSTFTHLAWLYSPPNDIHTAFSAGKISFMFGIARITVDGVKCAQTRTGSTFLHRAEKSLQVSTACTKVLEPGTHEIVFQGGGWTDFAGGAHYPTLRDNGHWGYSLTAM